MYMLPLIALFGVFAAHSQSNVALYRPVIVDSDFRSPQNTSQFAVDGDKNPQNNDTRWVSGEGYPHFFEVSLDQTYSINRVTIYTGYNGYKNPIEDYQIQYWDGAAWQDAFVKTGNNSPAITNTFPAIETDRIRLYATKASDPILRLYEFEVYGVPAGQGTGTGGGTSADFWKTGGESQLTTDVNITASPASISTSLNFTNLNQVNISTKESIRLSSQSDSLSAMKLEVSPVSGLTITSAEAQVTAMSTEGHWNYHDHDLTNIKNIQADHLALGNLPIPTGYSLAVKGQAIIEGVKIQLVQNWPDYVFEDDYELKSLEQVLSYIKDHKHLPEVPSAAEVEKEGLSVGEMNAVLLKKIEELTLYLIAQEQRIKKLEEKNIPVKGKQRINKLEP